MNAGRQAVKFLWTRAVWGSVVRSIWPCDRIRRSKIPDFLFRKCRVWNSLSQGHDDEQHTTIFQKALLVANQVWMGLSEPNTQPANPEGSRLQAQGQRNSGTGRQAFQKADLNLHFLPNNQDMRNQYLITSKWKHVKTVQEFTEIWQNVKFNHSFRASCCAELWPWSSKPVRQTTLQNCCTSQFWLGRKCWWKQENICHMPWQQRTQYHRHRSHLKQVFHKKNTRKHCKREN